MTRVSTVLTILLICAHAQAQTPSRYAATTGDVVLSGAGTSFTVQQPTSNAKVIYLESAVVYCSVACSATQSANGTAATATAGPIVPLVPMGQTPSATVWTASNVGAGTASGGILHIPAATTAVLDLSRIVIPAGGTANNYTITISSITGTANVTLYWSEK